MGFMATSSSGTTSDQKIRLGEEQVFKVKIKPIGSKSSRRLAEDFPYIYKNFFKKLKNGECFDLVTIHVKFDPKQHQYFQWNYKGATFKQYAWKSKQFNKQNKPIKQRFKTLSVYDPKNKVTYYRQQQKEYIKKKGKIVKTRVGDVYFDTKYQVQYWKNGTDWVVEEPDFYETQTFAKKTQAILQMRKWQQEYFRKGTTSPLLDYYTAPWLVKATPAKPVSKVTALFFMYLGLTGDIMGRLHAELSPPQKKALGDAIFEPIEKGLASLAKGATETDHFLQRNMMIFPMVSGESPDPHQVAKDYINESGIGIYIYEACTKIKKLTKKIPDKSTLDFTSLNVPFSVLCKQLISKPSERGGIQNLINKSGIRKFLNGPCSKSKKSNGFYKNFYKSTLKVNCDILLDKGGDPTIKEQITQGGFKQSLEIACEKYNNFKKKVELKDYYEQVLKSICEAFPSKNIRAEFSEKLIPNDFIKTPVSEESNNHAIEIVTGIPYKIINLETTQIISTKIIDKGHDDGSPLIMIDDPKNPLKNMWFFQELKSGSAENGYRIVEGASGSGQSINSHHEGEPMVGIYYTPKESSGRASWNLEYEANTLKAYRIENKDSGAKCRWSGLNNEQTCEEKNKMKYLTIADVYTESGADKFVAKYPKRPVADSQKKLYKDEVRNQFWLFEPHEALDYKLHCHVDVVLGTSQRNVKGKIVFDWSNDNPLDVCTDVSVKLGGEAHYFNCKKENERLCTLNLKEAININIDGKAYGTKLAKEVEFTGNATIRATGFRFKESRQKSTHPLPLDAPAVKMLCEKAGFKLDGVDAEANSHKIKINNIKGTVTGNFVKKSNN